MDDETKIHHSRNMSENSNKRYQYRKQSSYTESLSHDIIIEICCIAQLQTICKEEHMCLKI